MKRPDQTTMEAFMHRAIKVMAEYNLTDPAHHAIVHAHIDNIEAIAKTILIAIMLEDNQTVIASGFATLFMYGYVCGQQDARTQEDQS